MNNDASRVSIKSMMYPWCATEVSIRSPNDPIDSSLPVTLTVRTGASYLQTYATREEIRKLAEMLLEHANENEVMEVWANEPQV